MEIYIFIILIIIAIIISIYFYKNEHIDNNIPIIEIKLSENEIEKSINLDNTPVDLYLFFDRSVYVVSEKITIPANTNVNPIVLESISEKYIRITIENENNININNIGLFIYNKNNFIYGDEIIKQGYVISANRQQNKITMILNRNLYDNNIIKLRINTNGITKFTVDTKQINFENTKEVLNNKNSKVKIKEIHLTNNIICPSLRCQLNVEEL